MPDTTLAKKLTSVVPVVLLIVCVVWLTLFRNEEGDQSVTTPMVSHDDGAMSKLPPEGSKKDDYPCGDVCSYNTDNVAPGKFYPLVLRNFSCMNLMARSYLDEPATKWPPPKIPPPDLLPLFTQNGVIPISETSYHAQRYSGSKALMSQWTKEYVEGERQSARAGKKIGSYGLNNMRTLQRMFNKHRITGMRGAVLGSESPWVEALCLNAGAKHVTTIEYGRINCTHPQIDTMTPREAGRAFLLGELPAFDFIVSFSSLEHSGLGRYGDALNPFGDLEATAQAWCMIKPGGFFFLGVPTGTHSHLRWNADRRYGPERAQFLTAGFLQHEIASAWQGGHSLFVVQKPPTTS